MFEAIIKVPIVSFIELAIPLVAEVMVADSVATKNTQLSEKLCSTIINCITTISKKVSDSSEKIEVIFFIVQKMQSHQSAKLRKHLLQCILKISSSIKQLNLSASFNEVPVDELKEFAVADDCGS